MTSGCVFMLNMLLFAAPGHIGIDCVSSLLNTYVRPRLRMRRAPTHTYPGAGSLSEHCPDCGQQQEDAEHRADEPDRGDLGPALVGRQEQHSYTPAACRNLPASGTAVAAPPPPFSTNTANAMSPLKPMNQACVFVGSAESNSAVPVLP